MWEKILIWELYGDRRIFLKYYAETESTLVYNTFVFPNEFLTQLAMEQEK